MITALVFIEKIVLSNEEQQAQQLYRDLRTPRRAGRGHSRNGSPFFFRCPSRLPSSDGLVGACLLFGIAHVECAARLSTTRSDGLEAVNRTRTSQAVRAS
jgi:hypothetical protein